ncbi:hypothetical protein B0H67DRAFT_603517 [Lasiosphaeris hirsuta]|uniref:Uncharacterized protein n=1 Tax=Lasiosphaeris hirsuta TaxID=260670 RepID=A0AA40A3M8_9PEZI|nr:hypothetical protein B0H67DRAFT_603517 [Lasiosphaeris hirsuta]
MANPPRARPEAEPPQDAMEGVGARSQLSQLSQPAELQCCCGRDECVFLRHNCSVLLSVERDVHTAAKMGQVRCYAITNILESILDLSTLLLAQHPTIFSMASIRDVWRSRQPNPQECVPSLTFALQTLLARHEAYMASAERDRVELTSRIDLLEHENGEHETKNQLAEDENKTLRGELEQLNDTVKDADTKIDLLEATLRDSQKEVRRLEGAAERAASLERQIAMLEEEQAMLQNTVVQTQEEARTAMFRWRQAERGLNDLQDQLERMEKEAREERERHVEVIGRMERQRVMEKELNTAAGRLKGAAAARSLTDSKGGNVVSHFVRDLLQDNATLQLGMAELREMLVNSNDEIQTLREQLLYHQPMVNRESGSTSTLRAELEHKEPPPPQMSQELHIHHHYHVTHRPEPKKPKRRRRELTAGTFTPPQYSAPTSPMPHGMQQWQQRGVFSHGHKDSASTISMPSNGRWSMMSDNPSDFSPSSVPSSPQSNPRNSLFDRGIMDMSFPDSPTTSLDPTSPAWRTSHRKRASEVSTRSISGTLFPNHMSPPQPHPLTTNFVFEGDIVSEGPSAPYTTDDVPDLTKAAAPLENTTVDTVSNDDDVGVNEMDRFDPHVEQLPRLRRVVSHESIMSCSNGMDIHTLGVRPSQLTLRPLGLTAAGTNLSAVTARPTIARGDTEGKRGSVLLRDNLAMVGLGLSVPKTRNREGGRVVSGPALNRSRNPSVSRRPVDTLSRLVSSWWGGGTSAHPSPTSSPIASPIMAATTEIHVTAVSSLSSPALSLVGKSPQGSLSSTGTFRAPGINQPGGIPGFNEYFAAHQRRGPPSKVSVDDLGQIQEAMREVLEET